MLYVVTYMCTIVGAYSCAVDANQCVRSLRRVGCMGATVREFSIIRWNQRNQSQIADLSEIDCIDPYLG